MKVGYVRVSTIDQNLDLQWFCCKVRKNIERSTDWK
ncbi:DNA invertase Pin-like site-specific DNA recombinase [Bacillus sp. RC145]